MKRDKDVRSPWPRILTYFLAAMLLLTLLSRAADSILLPVVKCARPYPGPLTHTVTLSGTIEAKELWPVMGEPDLAVARVYVREGQSVKAGDALLSYDTEALQRSLDKKQAELKKLTWEAQLKALEGTEQPTAQPTPAPSPAPDAEGDKSGREKAALEQQIRRLEIDKTQREVDDLAQLIYGGATLTAPVDGTISELLVKPGASATGAALLLSPATTGLIARADVTADQAKHLETGMSASFMLSGDARPTEGAVLVGLIPSASGYKASFALPDGAGSIGQSVSVTATQQTDTYLMRVPLGAIASSGGQTGVYRIRTGQSVLGDMEYADFVPVTVIESDMQYAAVSGSLSDLDQVIVSMSKPLSAGDRVRSSS